MAGGGIGAPAGHGPRRDFTGSTSVFSVVLAGAPNEASNGTARGTADREAADGQAAHREAAHAFVDALRLFGIGYSWGGVHSLAVPYGGITREHGAAGQGLAGRRSAYDDRLVRLNIGLENPEDLVADLDQALRRALPPLPSPLPPPHAAH